MNPRGLAIHQGLAHRPHSVPVNGGLADPLADPRRQALHGLLNAIPAPGTPWPRASRQRWASTLVDMIEWLYGDEDEEA